MTINTKDAFLDALTHALRKDEGGFFLDASAIPELVCAAISIELRAALGDVAAGLLRVTAQLHRDGHKVASSQCLLILSTMLPHLEAHDPRLASTIERATRDPGRALEAFAGQTRTLPTAPAQGGLRSWNRFALHEAATQKLAN